jgi:hypothetical protein
MSLTFHIEHNHIEILGQIKTQWKWCLPWKPKWKNHLQMDVQFISTISSYNDFMDLCPSSSPRPKYLLRVKLLREIWIDRGKGNTNKHDPSFAIPWPSLLFIYLISFNYLYLSLFFLFFLIHLYIYIIFYIVWLAFINCQIDSCTHSPIQIHFGSYLPIERIFGL